MHEQPAEKPLSGQEIIIVAIILAILSAILVPQYSRAGETAASVPAALRTLRSKLVNYRRTHDNQLPAIFYSGADLIDGEQVWNDLSGSPMVNPLNGRSSICVIDNSSIDFADGSATATPGQGNRHAPAGAGWIINSATGRAWATSADPQYLFNEADPQAVSNYLK